MPGVHLRLAGEALRVSSLLLATSGGRERGTVVNQILGTGAELFNFPGAYRNRGLQSHSSKHAQRRRDLSFTAVNCL